MKSKRDILTKDQQEIQLRRAIGALENALEIFNTETQNTRGRALAYYQLGYLYQNNFDLLFADKEINESNERIGMTPSGLQNWQRVYGIFKKAYKNFSKVKHLYGMYLSKKHMSQIGRQLNNHYPVDSDDEFQEQNENWEHDEKRRLELHKMVEEYRTTVGFYHSTFVSRE